MFPGANCPDVVLKKAADGKYGNLGCDYVDLCTRVLHPVLKHGHGVYTCTCIGTCTYDHTSLHGTKKRPS